MPKLIAVLLSIVLLLSLTGCALMKENVTWETVPGNTVYTTSEEVVSSGWDDTVSDAETSAGLHYELRKGTRTVMKDSSVNGNTNGSENESNITDITTVADAGSLSSTVPSSYVSKYDEQAKKLRNQIKNSADAVKVNGTTYYVSNNGDDNNNGTSPSTAWKTLSKVSAMQSALKEGDAVLLERGSLFRTTKAVGLKSGVSYGAYGSGAKPCVYGSSQNYANAVWENVGTNLWKLNDGIGTNIGIIVFDHGRATGYWRDTKAELTKNYDYSTEGGYVTLYLDKNPTKAFSSIEIGGNGYLYWMDNGSHDILIENICFKYIGGHAVRGSNCSNITVRNLEIGYVGGCILTGYGDGKTRYGNGIEFMSNSQNILVENNLIYQIYDSGVTHQGSGNYHLKGFTVRNNLIEYCGMGSIEYWHTADCDISDVTYEGNLLRFAGYGFGGSQRPDKNMTGHIMSNGKPTGAGYNKATNFIIKNNLFELSTYQLVNATSSANTPPVLSGNTYVQWKDKWLGYYTNVINRKFDDDVLNLLQGVWGDSAATVIFAE